jgi:hypothetical protein
MKGLLLEHKVLQKTRMQNLEDVRGLNMWATSCRMWILSHRCRDAFASDQPHHDVCSVCALPEPEAPPSAAEQNRESRRSRFPPATARPDDADPVREPHPGGAELPRNCRSQARPRRRLSHGRDPGGTRLLPRGTAAKERAADSPTRGTSIQI